MPNMSYCRFQNTLSDLQDCLDALSNEKPKTLSIDEQIARNNLIEMCREICENYEVEEVKSPVYDDDETETGTIIDAENWREIADALDYDFGRNQVFDNLADNSLVVVTEFQKGYAPTEYRFKDGLNYDECSEIARKMTLRLCNHYTPEDISKIVLFAAR